MATSNGRGEPSPKKTSETITSDMLLFPPTNSCAPELTCARILRDAAQDRLSYLSLLPPELRLLIDRLVSAPDWHYAAALKHLHSPMSKHISVHHSAHQLAVTASGERVLGLSEEGVRIRRRSARPPHHTTRAYTWPSERTL